MYRPHEATVFAMDLATGAARKYTVHDCMFQHSRSASLNADGLEEIRPKLVLIVSPESTIGGDACDYGSFIAAIKKDRTGYASGVDLYAVKGIIEGTRSYEDLYNAGEDVFRVSDIRILDYGSERMRHAELRS